MDNTKKGRRGDIRQTDKQTDRLTDKHNKNRQAYRQTDESKNTHFDMTRKKTGNKTRDYLHIQVQM